MWETYAIGYAIVVVGFSAGYVVRWIIKEC